MKLKKKKRSYKSVDATVLLSRTKRIISERDRVILEGKSRGKERGVSSVMGGNAEKYRLSGCWHVVCISTCGWALDPREHCEDMLILAIGKDQLYP